ncbi:hypothetical protein HWV62_31851 [Athelia sp. TMB]|nr:hypothetical protein HWV62_31851 [Athelia sp. TMB]
MPIPKFYFEKESSVFRDMFQMPSSGSREGDSDELPIVLQSIKKADFTALLAAMFPEQVAILIGLSKQGTNPIRMETKQWTAVLKLSTLWEFRKLRQKAIEELREMKSIPANKVVLGREYRVRSLLRLGYEELIVREARLSDKEKTQLGDKACIKVYEVREMTTVRTSGRSFGSDPSPSRDLPSVKRLVQDRFKAELRDAQGEGDEGEMEGNEAMRTFPEFARPGKRARGFQLVEDEF